jgi:Iron-sulfur cluster-binding domain/Radical SAM superfamily
LKVWACLELRATGPLGLPSRAVEKLGERSVLEHTVARVSKTPGLDGVAVLVEPGRGERARELLGGEARAESVRVLEVLAPDSPRRDALRRGRKWSKDSWRLGLMQSMEVDAAGHFPSLLAAARELNCDAVLSVYPEAGLVDPELLAGLIEHGAPDGQPPLPTATCQVPGGFAGLFAMAGWLEPMSAGDNSYGDLCAWNPERGSQDPVHRPENWLAPVAVRRCEFRGSLDSQRGRELFDELLRRAPGEDGLGPNAEAAAKLVTGDPALYAGRLPRVLEVELTSAGRVRFAQTPFAEELPARSMTRARFAKLLEDLSGFDDMLLTVGGWGDPLAHPELIEFLKLAREKGIYGLHLDTPGTLLDEAKSRELLSCDLDVISLRLGANSLESYKALTGRDDFDKVVANIEKLIELRDASGKAWPFISVEAEKRVEVEGELIDFWDRWSEKGAWPMIRPFSSYCGQCEDRATVHLTLAERVGCRRLMKEMVVLADGAVPLCRMDFRAAEPVGNIDEQSVEELWSSGRIAELRLEQQGRKFDGFKLCPNCSDWDNV